MGRRNKNIEVEIQETPNNTEITTELEVLVNKKIIGTVHQEKGEQASVHYKSGKEMTAKSVEDGIQMIIAEYNLHDQ